MSGGTESAEIISGSSNTSVDGVGKFSNTFGPRVSSVESSDVGGSRGTFEASCELVMVPFVAIVGGD